MGLLHLEIGVLLLTAFLCGFVLVWLITTSGISANSKDTAGRN